MFTLHSCACTPQGYLGPIGGGWKKVYFLGVQKFVPNLEQLMFTLSAKNEQLCEKYVLSTLFYKSNMIHNLNYKN